MITIDWAAFGLGAIAGAAVGAVFFVGLALGMRLALRSAKPAPILLLSSVLRIAVLLGIGWLIAQRSPTALAAFTLTFVAARFVAIAVACTPAGTDASRCN